jgi:hypothetical protein
MVQAVCRRPHTAEERVQPRPFHMGYVVDKVVLIPVYLPVLRFSPVSTIPPVLQAHSLAYSRRYMNLAMDTALTP